MGDNPQSRQISDGAGRERQVEPISAILIQTYKGDNERTVDFAALARFLFTRWLSLGVFAFAGAALLVGCSYLFPRVYRAEVLVAPVSAEPTSAGLGSLLSRYGSLASAVGIDVSDTNGSTAKALALLQSRQFIERFITDKSLLPVLFPQDFADKGSAAPNAKRRTLQDAYNLFTRKIMLVRQDKLSKLITIRIDWHDRKLAADWANELVARVNASTRANAIREADESLKYLRVELQKADYVALQQSISSVIEAQINRRMLANTRPDYSFEVIDPAQPSDPNKSVGPKRIIFLIVGVLLGFASGVTLAVRGADRSQWAGRASGGKGAFTDATSL
jgi:uncharacterized protein involved in exopolysaccharide biosynthesis